MPELTPGYELWGEIKVGNDDCNIRAYCDGADGDKVVLIVTGAEDALKAVRAAETYLEEQEGQEYTTREWTPA